MRPSHERLGYNYRMGELSAALGVAQMSRIEEIIARRERVAAMYAERLARVPVARLPYVAPEETCMSSFVYVIRVSCDELSIDEPATERKSPERQSAVRDHVMRRIQEPTGGRALAFARQDARVGRRPYFAPVHLQPFYRAECGLKEGDVSHIELSGSASTATCWKRQSPRHRL